MLLTVCIPMYNEIAAVSDSAKKLINHLEKLRLNGEDDYELIFSDDGSTDDCASVIEKIAEDCSRVKLVKSPLNKGKGSAVRRAVEESRGDIVVYTDCDLAYGVDVIEKAFHKLKNSKCDILVGSRNMTKDGYDGYGCFRKIASKTYIKILSSLGGLKLSDSQCGFKAFRKKCAADIFSACKCDGFAFDYEVILLAYRFGYIIEEMPVKIICHKESKVSLFKDSINMFREFIKIKRRIRRTKF